MCYTETRHIFFKYIFWIKTSFVFKKTERYQLLGYSSPSKTRNFIVVVGLARVPGEQLLISKILISFNNEDILIKNVKHSNFSFCEM